MRQALLLYLDGDDVEGVTLIVAVTVTVIEEVRMRGKVLVIHARYALLYLDGDAVDGVTVIVGVTVIGTVTVTVVVAVRMRTIVVVVYAVAVPRWGWGEWCSQRGAGLLPPCPR